MKKNVWDYILYFKYNILVDLGIEAAAFVIGSLICIFAMGRSDGTFVVPFGSILAAGCIAITAIFSGIFLFGQQYNVAVAMGCTRNRFLRWYLGTSVVFISVEFLFLYCTYQFERHFYPFLFPLKEIEGDLSMLFHGKILLILVLAAVIVKYFTGGIVLKYGKTGFLVLWGSYMIICLLTSKITMTSSEKPDGICAKIMEQVTFILKNSAPNTIYLIGFAILMIMFFSITRMLLRQDVKYF